MTYHAVHYLLAKHCGPAGVYRCCGCGLQAAVWAYDWTEGGQIEDEKGRRYSTNLDHYYPLCYPCHSALDLPYFRGMTHARIFATYPSAIKVEAAKRAGLWPPPPRRVSYVAHPPASEQDTDRWTRAMEDARRRATMPAAKRHPRR